MGASVLSWDTCGLFWTQAPTVQGASGWPASHLRPLVPGSCVPEEATAEIPAVACRGKRTQSTEALTSDLRGNPVSGFKGW